MASSAPPKALSAAPGSGAPTHKDGDEFVLSDCSVQQLARMWRMLDDDTDGLLDPQQLRTMIAAIGIPPTRQLVEGIQQCTPEKWRHVGVDIDTVCGRQGCIVSTSAFDICAQPAVCATGCTRRNAPRSSSHAAKCT